MDNMFECDYCGALSDMSARKCGGCGAPFTKKSEPPPHNGGNYGVNQPPPVPPYGNGAAYPQNGQGNFQQWQNIPFSGINPHWPVRNKVIAGVLAIFFGGLGAQFFYLGRPVAGVLCVIFCWTFIPSLVGLGIGVIYIAQSDYMFQMTNKVRVHKQTGE